MSTDDFMDSLDPFGHGPMHFDKQGNPITMRQWGELRHSWVFDENGKVTGDKLSDYAHIGEDFVGEARVSTVWLGSLEYHRLIAWLAPVGAQP